MALRIGYRPSDDGKRRPKGKVQKSPSEPLMPAKSSNSEVLPRAELIDDPSIRGFNSFFVYRDEAVDVRSPPDLGSAIRVNLLAAKEPRAMAELIGPASGHRDAACLAAEIGRSASSTVFILCVAHFQARLNWCIAALDPALAGTSSLLIEEGRLTVINLARLLYSFNGVTWNSGESKYSDFELVVKVRNELVHDKPLEGVSENIDADVEKWRLKFRHRVPDLDWIPRVRASSSAKKPFGIYGESALQRFMKYPVAAWAHKATMLVVDEMCELLRTRDGGMKMTKETLSREPTKRFEFAGE